MASAFAALVCFWMFLFLIFRSALLHRRLPPFETPADAARLKVGQIQEEFPGYQEQADFRGSKS